MNSDNEKALPKLPSLFIRAVYGDSTRCGDEFSRDWFRYDVLTP